MFRKTVERISPCLYHRAMPIGLLIQAWRLSKKHSLESLSDLAHIPSALLEQIESEEADPSTATVQALAAALRIPPAWLFDDPRSFDYLFQDAEDSGEPPPCHIDPVTDRILACSRVDRSLYVLLTALMQAGDPKLLRAAEMSLRSLAKQARQPSVPWLQRPSGHFEPPSD
jgi:transcriptional regulator with XRE-family HTH domain